MARNQDDYHEGFNDCAKQYLKTHISLDEVTASFDKFLDKINKLKRINKHIYNHFKKNIDVTEKEMIGGPKVKKLNLAEIIKLIEIEMAYEMKK